MKKFWHEKDESENVNGKRKSFEAARKVGSAEGKCNIRNFEAL